MSPQARIRRARPGDAARILQMEASFPSDRMSARSVRRFLSVPTAAVLVADAAGEVLGNLILLIPGRSAKARIYSVVTDPAARGRGIARALVTRAEGVARRAGRAAVTLEVRTDNAAARALYDALGYAEVQLLERFYEDGADGVQLAKPLRNPRLAR